MADLENLQRHVIALKKRLRVQARLRTGGDRDLFSVAKRLRAQQYTIQALGITQSQHNEKLGQHEASLSAANGKLDQIVTLLSELIDRDERRGDSGGE